MEGSTLSVSVKDADAVTPYLVRRVVLAGGMVQSVEVLKLVVEENEA